LKQFLIQSADRAFAGRFPYLRHTDG